MDLKTLCMNNLVDMIKNLPPQLKDEVIEASIKNIRAEAKAAAKKEIMKEIRDSALIVVEDVTELLTSSSRTGKSWKRPEYTKNIDDELYQTFVNIAEQFFNKKEDQLVFNNSAARYPTGINEYTSDEEESE